VINRSERLRVVVATPLSEEHCELIERLEPRIDLIHDQSLCPPMRHPADFSGDPSFRRTPDQQRAFEEMLDSAEVLYGIPDLGSRADAHAAAAEGADSAGLVRWAGQSFAHLSALGSGAAALRA
jgi:hypothetical protein